LNQHVLQFALSNVLFGSGLFYGPIIYFYIKALIYQHFSWRLINGFHFFPTFILSGWATFPHVESYVAAMLIFLSLAAYLFMSLWAYWRFRQVISQTQSADDLITMNWVAVVLGFNTSTIVVNIIVVVIYAYLYHQFGSVV
jgi:hypothetical protein